MTPQPRKRFGQHFLHDPAVIERIVNTFQPDKSDFVVEIGPGQGILTRALVHRVARFTAVEIDRDLAASLEQEFVDKPTVSILTADALSFNFCALMKEIRLRVIGNLPYNISTPLLFHLFQQSHCIRDMLFMLQKEVVDRLCAIPGNKTYGRLSVMAQWQCKITRQFTVGSGAFSPPPRVDSAVVRLVPHNKRIQLENREHFSHLVQAAFNQRRKTLRNALKDQVDAVSIKAAGIDASRRAETLTVEEFAALSNITA